MALAIFVFIVLTCTSVVHCAFEAVIRGPGLTPIQQQIIVDTHNQYRRFAGANNMMKMEYSLDLEQTAQRAADRCIYDHSPKTDEFRPKYLNPPSGAIGENIYVSPNPSFDADVPVTSWWSEITDYRLATGACRVGRMCGHYTQVVWAYSSKVGCAVSKCASIDQWGNRAGLLMFCQYAPGGNVEGMSPYEEGKACTNCYDSNLYCDHGLCSHSAPGPEPTPKAIEVVTGNQVCEAREAADSYMCLHQSYYNSAPPGGDAVCAAISCSTSRLSSFCCKTASSDGLPCGVGKICQDGRCRNDPTGTTTSLRAGCLYGDMKKFRWNGKLTTCAEMIASPEGEGKWNCKNAKFRELCCDTCWKIERKTSVCPYGNHPSCKPPMPPFIQCINDNCCDKASIPGGCTSG